MMSLTFGLFTQVSGSGPLGPLVFTKLCHFFDLEFSKCSLISLVPEDISLNLRVVVHYQKGNLYQ